jgi:hypothetical protein
MKLITVVVKADLDKNRYTDGTTIADHLDRIVNGSDPEHYDNVYLAFGTGDLVVESTLVAISVTEE